MKNPQNAGLFALIVFILFLTDFRQPFWMILLISFSAALLFSLFSSDSESDEVSHHDG